MTSIKQKLVAFGSLLFINLLIMLFMGLVFGLLSFFVTLPMALAIWRL